MKKVLLVLALAVLSQFAIAQNQQVQNAFNFQKSAQQYIEQADAYRTQNKTDKAAKQMNSAKQYIQRAKEAIDAASAHEATMNQAKTWHYYAVIYYKIGAYPEFHDVDTEAFSKVLVAVDKIQSLDHDYFMRMGQELSSYVNGIDNTYYQLGVDSFNNGNYEDAIANFQKANDAANKIGNVDDAALINLASCANKLGRYELAAQTFEMLINKGYDDASNYAGLIIAYRELKEGDKAVATIEVARAKYPDDPNLINEMINTYINLHRESEIIDQIEAMAQKFTDQPIYYFILGTIYGNSESELYDLDKALGYYDKAIQEDQAYSDAYYNAGALLSAKATDIKDSAEQLKEKDFPNMNAYFKATDEIGKQANVYYEKALPYLEKAHELLPDDPDVKRTLKGIYTRLNMQDKAKALEN